MATGQVKVKENLIFFKNREKSGNFAKMVREILNTKKVRETSGNFLILAVAGILSILSDRKLCFFVVFLLFFFFYSLCSLSIITNSCSF